MKTKNKVSKTGRRAELMTELFLQELNPILVAQANNLDYEFDYLIAFHNNHGGINTFAVEVKSTEKPVAETFVLRSKAYNLLANSNIPVLLLVVDVKKNEFFYAWPSEQSMQSQQQDSIKIPVFRIDEETKQQLLDRMIQ